MALPVSAMYPEYVIQQSSNLVNWTTVAGPFSGSVGVSDEFLRVAVPTAGAHAFYRVVANVKLAAGGSGIGDAIYGYGTAFGQQLQQLGQLSLEDFVSTYQPTNQYLPQITFDPTTAEFWNLFSIDPAVWNATNSWSNQRVFDFRLNPTELAVFQTNGFVVSQRLERRSFADVYYDLYTDDLPVFVTADSVLQAWHRSFVTMLAEIEETCFQQTLSNLVVSMSAQVPTLWAQSAGTAMTSGVLDADYFLAVAQSLVSGVNNYGSLGQSARVTTTLNAINNLQPLTFNLYGEPRDVDFSQFTVRGHYVNSTALTRYFRAMIWCGLADFRYAGFSTGAAPGGTNTLRELSGAVALELLLRNSGGFSNWFQFNRTLEMLVGTPDSLNFAQLNGLLVAAGINSPADLPNQAALTNLQNQLMSGQLGMQQITSGYYYSPFSPEQVKLPRSFCFMGQRFVMDSWASGNAPLTTSFGMKTEFPMSGTKSCDEFRVRWTSPSRFSATAKSCPKSPRVSRAPILPSPMAGRIGGMVASINTTSPPCATSSTAKSRRVDQQHLQSLAGLSATTFRAHHGHPISRSHADTRLGDEDFEHPTRFLDAPSLHHCALREGILYPHPPVPVSQGLRRAAPGLLVAPRRNGPGHQVSSRHVADQWGFQLHALHEQCAGQPRPYTVSVSGATIYTNRLALMDHFVSTMDTLRAISEKELSKTPFSAADNLFLQQLVEFDYAGKRTYTGWYPRLFYQTGKRIRPPERPTKPGHWRRKGLGLLGRVGDDGSHRPT